MRPQPGRTKLGVLAVAFDAAGRDPERSRGRPRSAAGGCGMCPCRGRPRRKNRLAPPRSGGSWRKPDWSVSARVRNRSEAAVRGMLDVERWQTPGGGLDLLDLLLVSPGPSPPPAPCPKKPSPPSKSSGAASKRSAASSSWPRHLRNRRRGRPCRTRQPPALRPRIGRRLLRRHPPPRPHQYREYGHQRHREAGRRLPESFITSRPASSPLSSSGASRPSRPGSAAPAATSLSASPSGV